MAAALPIVGGLLAGSLVSKALAPKVSAAPVVAVPRQVQVRTNSQVSDALMARRGSRANQRTGPRGAEAPMGTKTKMGQ